MNNKDNPRIQGLGTSQRKDEERKRILLFSVFYNILSIPYIEALAKGAAKETKGARMRKRK